MPNRHQKSLPLDDQGHEERLRRANARTVSALRSVLAQDDAVLEMGTSFHVRFRLNLMTGEEESPEISVDMVDNERLGHLATQLRPFQLRREAIYHPNIVESLRRFATESAQQTLVEQLPRLWSQCERDRMITYVQDSQGNDLLPEGAGDKKIADRVLYSQIVHADDARAVLDHVATEWQQWSVAGLVGDWAAMAAHQQYVMHYVRPDLVPELTSWAGSPETIFSRLGATVRELA